MCTATSPDAAPTRPPQKTSRPRPSWQRSRHCTTTTPAPTANRLDLNIAWLIGTARHKLIDHWRRTERRKEELAELWDDMAVADPTDAAIEVASAQAVLAELAPSSSRRPDAALPRRSPGRRRRHHHRPNGARNRGVAHPRQEPPSEITPFTFFRAGDVMTDPFDALRITDAPLDPRPEFAAELRRTITTTLENTMTDTDTEVTDATQARRPSQQAQSITAYISVRNAAAAMPSTSRRSAPSKSAAWSATTAASVTPRSRSATAS